MKPKKAAGPDGIPSDFLRALPDEALPHLLRFINRSWEAGELPKAWLRAFIRPLHKSGKDATLPSSHRPIWLTSVIAKLAEKMVQMRLLFYTMEHPLTRVHRAQAGGMLDRDCSEHLAAHTAFLQQATERGLHSVVLYLDMKGAFDRVPRRRLLQRLAKKKIIPRKLLRWLAAFLSEREINVNTEGCTSTSREILTGVAQGSVLGPTLYILYLSDLLNCLDEAEFTCNAGTQLDETTLMDLSKYELQSLAFVDDLTLVITAPTRSTAVDIAQQVLRHVGDWCVRNHAVISAEKSVAQYLGPDARGATLDSLTLPLPSSRRTVKTTWDYDVVKNWLRAGDLRAIPPARIPSKQKQHSTRGAAAPAQPRAPLTGRGCHERA
jgi:hypothetical protein